MHFEPGDMRGGVGAHAQQGFFLRYLSVDYEAFCMEEKFDAKTFQETTGPCGSLISPRSITRRNSFRFFLDEC